MTGRTFTEDVGPPFGERVTMVTPKGLRLVWAGDRWAWEPFAYDARHFDSWPPNEAGPYFEVPA